MLRVIVAGATGNVGRCVVRRLADDSRLALVAAVARRSAGERLASIVAGAPEIFVSRTIEEALAKAPADVLIDFTTHEVAAEHASWAIGARLHVVLGATGFAETRYGELDAAARAAGVAVAACDNFAVSAALLSATACLTARYLSCDEVMDVAAPGIRAPLNTTRRLAQEVAEVSGRQVAIRSVRDGSAFSLVEAVFTSDEERITIRHESKSFRPYAEGACAAARALPGRTGLYRRLEELLSGAGS